MSSNAAIGSIRRHSWRLAALAAVVAAGGCGGASAPTRAAPEWRSLAPAALARTEVAAARVGRFVYVMGGFERTSGAATTAATERYDIERDRWARVADMPVALNHAAATSYRGRVYVVGGYRGDRPAEPEVATLYRYDPMRDRWRRLPSAPTKRGALAAGVIGHRLYVAGGANSRDGALATLEIYDFHKCRWRRGRTWRWRASTWPARSCAAASMRSRAARPVAATTRSSRRSTRARGAGAASLR
jgi:hypothetical protein